MIDLILGQFAPYLVALAGFAAAWFGIKSKVQSSKIEKQDEAIRTHEVNEVVLNQVVEAQKETIKQERAANEILNTNDDIDVVANRLRERAARKNSNSSKK